MDLERLIAAARGDIPCDLLLANACVVNTATAEIEETDVAIFDGHIAGLGPGYEANERIDLAGRYVCPSLIDGHVHVESSHLSLAEYARAVLPHGTGAIVTDAHEIANVCGLEGIRYLVRAAESLPLDVFFMAPSCVPATHMETAGAELGPREIAEALGLPGVLGLGEVMNYPGVIFRAPDVLAKLQAANGRLLDGHAPSLSGKDLAAYVSAGIRSDHESTRLEEAREKLRRGMYVMIREGSSEKNLEELLPLAEGEEYRRCLFVVDDRTSGDLLHDGDVDAVVRKAIRLGLDPVRAIQMATINAAEYFRLDRMGIVAPGYRANLVVFDDLRAFVADMVYAAGKLIARDGKALFAAPGVEDTAVRNTFRMKPFDVSALALEPRGESFPIIELAPGQIVTRRRDERPRLEGGMVQPDVERDLLKLAVVERHRATGNIGLGLVRGFGLKRGAFASSIAHDSHNVMCVGASDADMYAAIREIERMQGGLAVAAEGQILGSLPLPIAGLLSDRPLEEVAAKQGELERLVRELGCPLESPFAPLSFLALPVIPEVRVTDKGIVDVTQFRLLE